MNTQLGRVSKLGPTRALSSLFARLFLVIACCALLVNPLSDHAKAAFAQDVAPSSTPGASLEKAEELLKQGKPREALSSLTILAEKNPVAPGLEEKLGKTYFRLGQYSQAGAHLQTALRQNAADLEALQLLALTFYAEGNCRDALPLLEKLGTQLPKDYPNAPYFLSICYTRADQFDNARKSLAQIFSVPPDSPMSYLMLGKLLVGQQRVDAAVPQIEKSLKLDPRLVMAHFLLGEIRLYQSNPDDAATEFKKELDVNPTLWLVYWRLGDAYVRLGHYDEAEKVLKEAIWMNDSSAGAIVLLGEIALKKNDPALASGFLERAISLDPQNLDAHEKLAAAYQKLGRDSDANRELEIARKMRSEKGTSEKERLQLTP
jgi:tetratricopeptide (TPR) repeat protein